MTSKDWTVRGLDDFLKDDEPLVYQLSGDTPGHRVDLDALHELFHEQSKYHRATSLGLSQNIRAHIEQPDLVGVCVNGRHGRGGQSVALPAPRALTGALEEALAKRASTRRGDLGGQICCGDLSTLLHHSVRANREGRPKPRPDLKQYFRPYPSAGGLYPCEVYLAVSAVEGIAAGIYRYDAIRHDLVLCRSTLCDGGAGAYASVETGQEATAPPCAIILTAVFERAVRKYGPRGYRLALIEAGHIMQNLSLVATSLSLGSLVSASFYEAELEALIGVDGVSEAVLAAVLIGR